MKKAKYDVFICYSRQDLYLVNEICGVFQEAGITTFLDINVLSDSNFKDVIVDGIKSSKLLVFLCTPHSIQSSWTNNEVSYAVELGKIVVPIIVDDTKLSPDLNFLLGRFRYFNIYTATLVSDIRCIAEKIKPSIESTIVPDREENADDQSVVESPPAAKAAKGKSTGKRILSILLYAIIGFVLIYYAFGVSYLFKIGDVQQGIAILSPLLIGTIALVLLIARLRKYELKLYCCSDEDSESILKVTVDDRVVSTIEGKGMVRLLEKRGDYLISIDSENPNISGEKFTYRFCRRNSGEVMQVNLKAKSSGVSEQRAQTSSDITEFRCFIAGSTRLVNERNATRAVLSVLYNKWESHNLVISSYTFEDFSNSYQTGGQQVQYNEFIRDKANCAIFIVTENIGDRTLEEYRLAVNTFNENHAHPKIFVYSNNLSDGEITKQFIDEVRKNNSYWREYDDIQLLMNLVKDDIDSELFNIFIFKKAS